jgi:sarcosine oxidase subunit beta
MVLTTKWLDTKEEIQEIVPIMNTDNLRYPVLGASFQPRWSVARHDAIAWGFAMSADEMGVDIIQNCEVTAILKLIME